MLWTRPTRATSVGRHAARGAALKAPATAPHACSTRDRQRLIAADTQIHAPPQNQRITTRCAQRAKNASIRWTTVGTWSSTNTSADPCCAANAGLIANRSPTVVHCSKASAKRTALPVPPKQTFLANARARAANRAGSSQRLLPQHRSSRMACANQTAAVEGQISTLNNASLNANAAKNARTAA